MIGDLTKSLVLWPLMNRRDWIADRFSFLISAINDELQDVNLRLYMPCVSVRSLEHG